MFAIALVPIAVFLAVLLWFFPKWQVRSIHGLDSKDRFDRENEARKTLSQILGGLILLIGFYFTWQNLLATKEDQITDRFTKAIGQLGEPDDTKLAVRLGGIYALERIAKDPKTGLHWPIMEILTSYVRAHAKINVPGDTSPKTPAHSSEPPADVQAILAVIGRRTFTYQEGEDQRLHLSRTDLSGARLFNANLRGVFFDGTDFTNAEFTGADLTGAKFNDADLSTARGLTSAQLESATGNIATKLPPNVPRPKSWE